MPRQTDSMAVSIDEDAAGVGARNDSRRPNGSQT
jgi:hypothetical protein